MKWLALVLALVWAPDVAALDANDRLKISLEGGELVDGWFVRAEADAVVVSVPGLTSTTRVPLHLIRAVSDNGAAVPMDRFRLDVAQAHQKWKDWVMNPPPHPAPFWVAGGSLIVPGTGLVALGEERSGWGYVIADLVLLGAGALELSNEQRLGVVVPVVGLNLLLRINSASDAVRVTNRRRRRLRDARAILERPTQR